MKRSTALIALGTLSIAVLTTALTGHPRRRLAAAARPQKVVVIGIDGALLSKIQAYNTPALKGLISTGSSSRTTLYAQPFAPTLSGPGWATNATGVWPDKHLVKSNSWGTGTNLTRYPDFLTRIQRARPELSTYAIADWTPLTTNDAGQAIFSDEVKRKVTYDGDALGWAAADAEDRDRSRGVPEEHRPGRILRLLRQRRHRRTLLRRGRCLLPHRRRGDRPAHRRGARGDQGPS